MLPSLQDNSLQVMAQESGHFHHRASPPWYEVPKISRAGRKACTESHTVLLSFGLEVLPVTYAWAHWPELVTCPDQLQGCWEMRSFCGLRKRKMKGHSIVSNAEEDSQADLSPRALPDRLDLDLGAILRWVCIMTAALRGHTCVQDHNQKLYPEWLLENDSTHTLQ